jgi:N-formylglutamate deformylase
MTTRKLLGEPPFDFHPGTSPLLVSMPHVGTVVPACMRGRLSPACEPLGDTDWHLPRLYDFVTAMGASCLVARHTRFAVDLNRPSDDAPLYATATTGLHPDILFDGTPAFNQGGELSPDERAAFLSEVWYPYHARLAAELRGLKERFGYALLLDAHSIASEIPRLFAGRLPDFNIGSADGRSADPELAERLVAVVAGAHGYTCAFNGRFKGGYITRHYGEPSRDIHAVQLELTQRTYMGEAFPFEYRVELASAVQPVLQRFVSTMLAWGDERYGTG